MFYEELYGSIKLENETVFYHHLSQDKEKLQLFQKGLKEKNISIFDSTIISRLRKLYFAQYTGLLYIYYLSTNFHNLSSKVDLLIHTMEDKDYQIVIAETNSTRDIQFYLYGVEHLDYDIFIEVKEGTKTWVYDLFSLLRIEKKLFYKLENPQINKIVSKSITNHPGYSENDYNLFAPFDYMLVATIQDIEKNIDTHPFKYLLKSELTRFKQAENYENIKLNWTKVEYEIKKSFSSLN